MTADTNLDEPLARLPKNSTREMFEEMEAARQADAARIPRRTIIPEPVMPPLWPHPDSDIIRFPCALACGWTHAEDTNAMDEDLISLPLSASPRELSRIFGERAERRGAELRERVQTAIRAHFAEAHEGQEPPEREIR